MRYKMASKLWNMVELSPTIIFLAILFSVPLQFYLSNSTSDTQFYLHRFVGEIHKAYGHILSIFRELNIFNNDAKIPQEEIEAQKEMEIDSETIDKESIRKGDMNELFGGSDEPRHPRPPYIKYRVGQVVKHKIHGYRGVIIAWDEKARAPEWWLKKVRGNKQIDEPNYTIIIDTRDRLIPQIGYVLERNIVLSHGAVVHPLIKYYFETFDGNCYKSRPWHKKVYPND